MHRVLTYLPNLKERDGAKEKTTTNKGGREREERKNGFSSLSEVTDRMQWPLGGRVVRLYISTSDLSALRGYIYMCWITTKRKTEKEKGEASAPFV